jgi:light-regulated signal transduction histidine kinase (bacteriophytochrome)
MSEPLSDLLRSCEREQLHLSGAIQPHGALLGVDANGEITHASANTEQFLGVAPRQLLGSPIATLCGAVAPLAHSVDAPPGERLSLLGERVGARACDVVATRTASGCLVEAYEAVPGKGGEAASARAPAFYKERRLGITALCEQIVAAVHRDTGFEKVMAYRFHDDWSGEVVAEINVNPKLDSYLGQRFPASDIPKNARDLYVKNASRSISNVTAASVPIAARDGAGLDLTYSELRSVSPVHLEYLANMGVGASCSFSIVVHGELWGLVACHNETARTVSLWHRNRCADYAKELAFALATYETDQKIRFIDRIDGEIERLLEGVTRAADLPLVLEQRRERLLDLVGATGAALVLDGVCTRFGAAPAEREILNIVEINAAEGLFVTDHLAGVFPTYDTLARVASGALVVHSPWRSRLEETGPRFAWFRPEELRTIVWAGDPRKSVELRGGEQRISPRTSFASWTEQMTGRGKRWTSQDLIAAQRFRSALLRWTRR